MFFKPPTCLDGTGETAEPNELGGTDNRERPVEHSKQGEGSAVDGGGKGGRKEEDKKGPHPQIAPPNLMMGNAGRGESIKATAGCPLANPLPPHCTTYFSPTIPLVLSSPHQPGLKNSQHFWAGGAKSKHVHVTPPPSPCAVRARLLILLSSCCLDRGLYQTPLQPDIILTSLLLSLRHARAHYLLHSARFDTKQILSTLRSSCFYSITARIYRNRSVILPVRQ